MTQKILKELNRVISELEKTNIKEASSLHNVFIKVSAHVRFCDKCGHEVGKYSSMCGACGAEVKKDEAENYSVLTGWDDKGESTWRPGTEEEKDAYRDQNSGHSVLDGWDESGESVWRPATTEERREDNKFDKGKPFCGKCGNEISPYSSMCGKCGTFK